MSPQSDNLTNSPVPSPGRSLGRHRRPQKESNPPIFDNMNSWSDQVIIRSLAFDRMGHLWGGGTGGVIRWVLSPNQIQYRVWQSEHGLAGNDVTCIHISADNRIICGHHSGWLSIFDHGTWHHLNTGTQFPVRTIVDTFDTCVACTDVGLFDIEQETLHADIPAPPRCLLTAFEKVWMGTESGLYYQTRGDTTWHLYEVPSSMRCVINLSSGHGYLWLASLNGAARIDEEGHLNTLPVNEAVQSITTIGNKLLLATRTSQRGLLMYMPDTDEIKVISAYPANTVVAAGYQAVQTTLDNALLLDFQNHEKRWLLPEKRDLRNEYVGVHRVFSTDDETYIQLENGIIQHKQQDRWHTLAGAGTAPLTGVVKTQHHTLVGVRSQRGTGIVRDGQIEFDEKLSYVFDLTDDGDTIYALTANGIYYLDNDDNWQAISLPDRVKINHLLARPSCLDTLYIGQNGLYRLSHNGATRLNICHVEGEVQLARSGDNGQIMLATDNVFYTGNTDAGLEEIDVPCAVEHITDAHWTEKSGLILATTQGLWRQHPDWQHLETVSSGLASTHICQLYTTPNCLWIMTSSGCTQIRNF